MATVLIDLDEWQDVKERIETLENALLDNSNNDKTKDIDLDLIPEDSDDELDSIDLLDDDDNNLNDN